MDRNPSRIAQILGKFFLLFYHFGYSIFGHQTRTETLKIELRDKTSSFTIFSKLRTWSVLDKNPLYHFSCSSLCFTNNYLPYFDSLFL